MTVYDRQVAATKAQIDNAIAADRFPRLARALGNTPPSRAELERIRLFGYPPGFHAAPSHDRWQMVKRIEASTRWLKVRDGTGVDKK